jgi:hypothetical protein
MAHATRTFWTQAEALEFIVERQNNVNSVNNLFSCIKIDLIFLLGRNSLFILFRISTGWKT